MLMVMTGSPVLATGMERIRVSDDQKGFVFTESGKPFVPWGFNYDHDRDGRLLEEYWEEQWAEVESDFAEMKKLGANVVRIHLQVEAFLKSPTEPKPAALDRLSQLLKLAERTGLYLDITGLGCYHKQDVPAWYDELSEQKRWETQTVFWSAVAKTCADSPAVFFYDLMNEPVVPGGKRNDRDWLGPGFGGKHFVQFITLDQAGRSRPDIAKQWVKTLVKAIREHDQHHLITVGLVPWSLDRPGLTSGFVPNAIADDLDFIAMHIYPESDKVDEAMETLAGFAAVGKPVIIEEIFPLKCNMEDFAEFMERSKKHASGWIGFYWGSTPDELEQTKTFAAAITRSWLEFFEKHAANMQR